MSRPIEGSYAAYFGSYIQLVPEDNLREAFAAQQNLVDQFFAGIPTDKTNYAYAPGKWTIKLLMQHVIDTERIFNYRALSIARGEKQSLPGFEEDDYAKNSSADLRNWEEMTEELKLVRQSTIILFNSFSPLMLQNTGLANGKPVSVNALGFIAAGHVYHHINVVNQKYLS